MRVPPTSWVKSPKKKILHKFFKKLFCWKLKFKLECLSISSSLLPQGEQSFRGGGGISYSLAFKMHNFGELMRGFVSWILMWMQRGRKNLQNCTESPHTGSYSNKTWKEKQERLGIIYADFVKIYHIIFIKYVPRDIKG